MVLAGMIYAFYDVIAPSLFLFYSFNWVSPNILIGPLFIILTAYLRNFPTQNVYKEKPILPKKIDLPFVSVTLTEIPTCKVSHFEVGQVQGPVSLEIT
jgi:hypothetical protein